MDDRNLHGDDEQEDTDLDDLADTDEDDGSQTPADTSKEEDEPKKSKAALEEEERQKNAWLKSLREGKKTLSDMPKSLEWLKKKPEFDEFRDKKPSKKAASQAEIDSIVDRRLAEREASAKFDRLVEDLEELELSEEQEALMQEEYESIISEFEGPTALQKLKALTAARKIAGVRDSDEFAAERRKKGMVLPMSNGRRRVTAAKSADTEIEKRLAGNMPRGFKA